MEEQKEQEEWKPWKPEAKEEYFCVYSNLEIGRFFNWDDPIDDKLIKVGNCFKAREHAEQVAEKMRLLLRLEQLHDMLCPDYVQDWKDSRLKYRVYFSHFQGKYGVNCSNNIEDPCVVVFDTNKNAEKAAEILNKELEAKISILQDKLRMQKAQIDYSIKDGDEVYCISPELDVVAFTFDEDDKSDMKILSIGNCFKTRERAEHVANKIKFLLRLEFFTR